MIDVATGILSDLIVFSKYAKYNKEKNRRETWQENSLRLRNMYLAKFPEYSEDINNAFDYDKNRKVLASMRSHQFGGKSIELNNARLYNCSFVNITSYFHFSEILFLLLSGTGVGFSVQSRHINNLPQIVKPQTTRKYVIGDSIEGWADSVRSLVKAYFKGTPLPVFDYSDIRQKGLPLVTSGGKAPGPEPLKNCLEKINSLLSSKEEGSKLSSIEVHDIVCHLADAVLSGGIRRAALISIFDSTDNDMLKAKSYHSCVPYNGGFKYDESSDTYSGQVKYEGKIYTVYLSSKEYNNFNEYGKLAWYWFNPQRARANNSVVLFRNDLPEFGITATTREEYESIWEKCKKSNAGEPGILWSNHPDHGTNPCITGDSLVKTTEGYLRIDEIVEKFKNNIELPEIFSFNINKNIIEKDKITNAFLTKKQANIIKLYLEDGSELKLTPDHKVFTRNRGWVEAAKLTEKDILIKIS